MPVTVVDLAEIARGEMAENFQRKDFLPSEAVAIRRMLEPVEKQAGLKRMSEGGRGGNLPHVDRGKAPDKIAAYTGVAARTLDKADAKLPVRCFPPVSTS